MKPPSSTTSPWSPLNAGRSSGVVDQHRCMTSYTSSGQAAVAREVKEECGISTKLVGVVSIRHTHGVRFGQGDLYVLCKMLADADQPLKVDAHELLDAQWMSRAKIQSLVTVDPKAMLDGLVSSNNWKMIKNALDNPIIEGEEMPNSRGGQPSMLYTAEAHM